MKVAYAGKTKKELVLTALKSLGKDTTLKQVSGFLKSGGVPVSIADIHPSVYYPMKREFNRGNVLVKTKPTKVKVKPTAADFGKSTSQTIREVIQEYMEAVGVMPKAEYVSKRLKEMKRDCNSSLIYQQMGAIRKESDAVTKEKPSNEDELAADDLTFLSAKKYKRTFVKEKELSRSVKASLTISDMTSAHTLLLFLNKHKWTLKQLGKASKILAAMQL